MKPKLTRMLTPLLVLIMSFSYAQEKTINGVVTDQSGLALPGVSIIVVGTTKGTQTDFDGNYSIIASVGQKLKFSYIGQKTTEKNVGDSSTINVQLLEDSQALDEVVVVAYGSTTKEAFTGSAAVVDSKDLALRSITSPIAAIEGKATGVQFVSSSGQPGSSPSLVIRGVGTLNGGSTDPLYIVDGIQFEGALSSLNQNDIESLTVLKDAASTSLYGSRAANGVVIITTKNGRNNSKITVNVTSQFGIVSKGIGEYEAVGPAQYYELMWEAYKNSLGGAGNEAEASASIFNRLGYNPFNVANDQIVGVDGKINPNAELIYNSLDWYDALERAGSRTSHSIDISGGGENHQVFFSASYLDEEGYVIESDYERITTRINADFSPTDWLTLGGGMNLAITDSHGPTGAGTTSTVNPFAWAKNLGSIYPVYINDLDGNIVVDEAGDPVYDLGEGYSEYNIQTRPYNPGRHGIAEAILNEEVTKINNIGFRYFAEFKLLEGLKARINYGQDIQDFINKSYENAIVGDGAPTGRYGETRFRRNTENFTQLLTYNKSFGSHNLEVTLGHESFDRHYSENNGLANTQTADGIYEFDNFSVVSSLGGYSSDKKLEGYFARLNYNFDNKYYLSGSFRRDGSSVFSLDSRWGNFYSLGGSWRIDQEDFMSEISFVDNLKLRGSYGEVGNDDLGSFYISQALTTLYSNAGNPAIYFSSLGNDDLKWETSESFDVALEFGLFNNALEGSVEYYKKNTTDLLYNLPIPTSEGLNEAPFNIGDLYNSGYEIGLTGHFFKSKKFNWDLTVQASTLKNEITDLPEPSINGSKRWAEGHSAYDYYIYHYAGVDIDNGDALYYMFEEDIDTGEQVAVLDGNGEHATTNDFQDAGLAYTGDSSVPDLIGSISNSFNYEGLSLDFTLVYGIGGKILDYGYADLMSEGVYGEALHVDALNAWREPGDVTDVPRLENGNTNQSQRFSTRFLTDASYIALRNVNLSYVLDDNISERLGVNTLRLFVSGENLFLKSKRTGLNPQYNLAGTPSGNDYNPSSVLSFGVNVSF
ncbi:SusC/RagA family TonB-linked outer membrane protein [Cellulophaga baltica]|uniref:SusC/RagA family TonB-linked outer membrane protein n=1 Tax=Cellulophaga TaxID=104264 RepID=UPI001C072EFE|nr:MULTISPECIES: SusC/RagA family TonB-linked outer membrane protein [Cellulophaga]MBU2995334.1 SusC/RagA family TonB-linked outer membrane protein [Cellulophaga baltica]MDO6766729.1 SusC/RagA family TonB-linked outer membrane protein [Cellulophaga sp. 1_MG-2023]